jgi:hypothetical protein
LPAVVAVVVAALVTSLPAYASVTAGFTTGVLDARPASADGTNAEPKRPASKLAVATAVANFFLIDIL